VNQHNLETSLGLHSFTLAQNEYSDMSSSEVQRVMNGYKGKTPRNNTGTFKLLTNPQLPEEVDWRKEPGYVSPVKNQGQCGSCWSFSTTGALEGQHFKKTGEQVDLSEQQLVDCSRSYGNNGCEGGLMDYAFQYIKDNQGLDTEQGYPYEGEDDQCRFKKSDVGATDNGFVDVTSESEEALKQAVANIGPTSVAIDASHPSFQMYSRGVYDEPECNQEQLDHGVLVVGYGTSEEGKDFWIVKNSWGESWGENGYIRMSRNKDNQCGIASVASYPTV
jgi:cathepsin L